MPVNLNQCRGTVGMFNNCKIAYCTGPFLEGKGMSAIFQKKSKKMLKKGKIFEDLYKNVQNLKKKKKILKKGRRMHAIIACNKLLEKALL